ncbi:MAG: flagellar basal body rod protein FlgB [Candidatus Omnitrophica bacterium]|nr:flagellar basal body rod protein FlgB [Candidatus Omnitrophota bacterium]
MIVNPFFDSSKTNRILQASLDAHGIRQRALVHNIANVDTPGYRRIRVDFEEQLQKASEQLARGVDRVPAFAGVVPTMEVDMSRPLRADGSNVSIEREMADLSQNASKITQMTELLIRNYRDLKAAINGRS